MNELGVYLKFLPLLSVLPNTDAKLFSVTKAPLVITGLVVGLTAPNAEKRNIRKMYY